MVPFETKQKDDAHVLTSPYRQSALKSPSVTGQDGSLAYERTTELGIHHRSSVQPVSNSHSRANTPIKKTSFFQESELDIQATPSALTSPILASPQQIASPIFGSLGSIESNLASPVVLDTNVARLMRPLPPTPQQHGLTSGDESTLDLRRFRSLQPNPNGRYVSKSPQGSPYPTQSSEGSNEIQRSQTQFMDMSIPPFGFGSPKTL